MFTPLPTHPGSLSLSKTENYTLITRKKVFTVINSGANHNNNTRLRPQFFPQGLICKYGIRKMLFFQVTVKGTDGAESINMSLFEVEEDAAVH